MGALLLLMLSAVASAQPATVHVVRPGETLASIADRYYGDPNRENVLVAENGLTTEGGSSIVVGLRLTVPVVSYHTVVEGDTWASLAERYFGESRRAFALVAANGGSAREQPDSGAELLIPYPLRHVAAQNETLRTVARSYLNSIRGVMVLRRFNRLQSNRLQRGDILLVPLNDLVFSEQGRQLAEEQGAAAAPQGDVRAKQASITAELPSLRDMVRQGQFVEAVSLANRLSGMGDLTGNQVVTIQRELGTSYVALNRIALAREAFTKALSQQPDLELDIARTSPKVRLVFDEARSAMQPSQANPADGATPPEGASDPNEGTAGVDGGEQDAAIESKSGDGDTAKTKE